MSPSTHAPIFLGERAVERCLDMAACIDAVEAGFRDLAMADDPPTTGVLTFRSTAGGFHIKAAHDPTRWFAAKLNANFPGNPARAGLPTIQGLLLLSDAQNGRPLAVMHSGAVTRIRTGAATGVAVRHLANPGCRVAALIGCGAQGFDQLRALRCVLPEVQVCLFDLDRGTAAALATRASAELALGVVVAPSLEAACQDADVIVTCTPARVPFLNTSLAGPGSLVVGVGADYADKNEIDPGVFAASVIITDVTDQCAGYGDLHHALIAGAVTRDAVRAELAQVVAGEIAARLHPTERIVFDSTGTPIQDLAAALVAWRRAGEIGEGLPLPFDD